MARTLVYLVRHGEQDAGGGGLSDLGRRQSHLLGQRLRAVPFTTVHHSPLPRAAETATIVAGYLPDVPVHACGLVADRTPLPSPAQAHQIPERYADFLGAVPDEERDEGAVRLQEAVEHVGSTGAEDRYELVVTHNFVIGWFVRHALDAPIWRWIGLNQFNCGLTMVQWRTDRAPTLVSFNDIGHLPPQLRGQVPVPLHS